MTKASTFFSMNLRERLQCDGINKSSPIKKLKRIFDYVITVFPCSQMTFQKYP